MQHLLAIGVSNFSVVVVAAAIVDMISEKGMKVCSSFVNSLNMASRAFAFYISLYMCVISFLEQ